MALRHTKDPSMLAFSMQNLTDVVIFFSFAVRFAAEMQNFMTSSQRVVEYIRLQSEDDLEKEFDHNLRRWK
jgi:hypothetical protein